MTNPIELDVNSQADWRLTGAPWTQDPEGIISPPQGRNDFSAAVFARQSFSNATVAFEYQGIYGGTGHGVVGLILRASDFDHYYLLYFPWGGQQLRAKHFWAALAIVRGDGYIHNLKLEMVPGVPSETERWYHVRVEIVGQAVSVWVDGRQALQVTDDTYAAGCIGLACSGQSLIRHLRIVDGQAASSSWQAVAPTQPSVRELSLDSRAAFPTGCLAPNGDVLLASGDKFVRSTDHGRTWLAPQRLPETLGNVCDYGSSMLCTSGGRLLVMVWRRRDEEAGPVPDVLISESADNGNTWSQPATSQMDAAWPAWIERIQPCGPVVETADGALLRFAYYAVDSGHRTFNDIQTWSAQHFKACCFRSLDGGRSWSAPIELDRPTWPRTEGRKFPGALDFTEVTAVAMGNTVTALIRPVYSRQMWQCWSDDGGATWDAAVRTTFPGYAQTMVRTACGTILCAHRYPQYTVHASYDGGLNWDQGVIIDQPAWANGCMIEVEPDVVLCIYMGWERDQPLLAQRIKVTTSGISPLDD